MYSVQASCNLYTIRPSLARCRDFAHFATFRTTLHYALHPTRGVLETEVFKQGFVEEWPDEEVCDAKRCNDVFAVVPTTFVAVVELDDAG